MNLRNRSLLILGLTFFTFFIIIAAVMLSVSLSGLDRIENEDLADAINQTHSAIRSESSTLLGTVQDWAWWDEMYQFAAVHNADFIRRNVDTSNMETIRIHLLMVLDENGNLVYGRILSPDFQDNESVPDDVVTLIRGTPGLAHLTEGDPGTSGILALPEGPMIVASTPILRSDSTGPARGTLVMGRYFAYGPLQRIGEITGYHISLSGARGGGAAINLPAGPLPTGRSTGDLNRMIVVNNESTITGYSLQNDLAGRDLVLGVTMERTLYRTGFANIVTYLLLLVLWAVMTGLIVLVVMDRTILQRMGRLTEHVRSLSDKPGEVPAPVLSGNDELANLEKTIIASRNDLLIREQQMRVFINAIPSPAALFSLKGKILLANPAFAEYLHRHPDEILGTDISANLSGEELERYNRYAREAIRKKEIVHFENETGGKTYYMAYYPVLGNDGEVIQLGLLTFDISERKRLENALQKLTRKITLLNTVIFSDIQNKVFVQMGYLELTRQMASDPQLKKYLEKEEEVVREIQDALQFARQYNDMGANPPRWQNVQDVMLYAISHLDLGSLKRDFQLAGLEIFADSLLERVLVTLVENTVVHATGATLIRAGYSLSGDDAVIIVEDDGQGIPEDRKEAIFEKSLGTGLFLSREILSITGITILENGIPGKGARFEIRVTRGSYRFSSK